MTTMWCKHRRRRHRRWRLSHVRNVTTPISICYANRVCRRWYKNTYLLAHILFAQLHPNTTTRYSIAMNQPQSCNQNAGISRPADPVDALFGVSVSNCAMYTLYVLGLLFVSTHSLEKFKLTQQHHHHLSPRRHHLKLCHWFPCASHRVHHTVHARAHKVQILSDKPHLDRFAPRMVATNCTSPHQTHSTIDYTDTRTHRTLRHPSMRTFMSIPVKPLHCIFVQ